MFGCHKMFSGKYIFSGNANFRKRKIFFHVWLHFKKFSGKYFLVFGKEKGKHKPKKNTINDRDLRSRSCRRDLAINDASSRRREIAVDLRSRARDGAISRRRSRSEIVIWGAISRRREIAPSIAIWGASSQRRDLRSRCRDGARSRSSRDRAAWSSDCWSAPPEARTGDRHRLEIDWLFSFFSSLARALSLSLSFFFQKCFEVKMRGENHFRVKGENTGQPEVIFRKISFSVTAKHTEKGENDFLKSFSPKTNAP